MIEAKEAAQAAAKYLLELSATGLIRTPKDVRLEELEFVQKGSMWRVTLSFVHELLPEEREPMTESIANLALAPRRTVTARVYKTFEVLGGNGEVRAMKIRNPDARE